MLEKPSLDQEAAQELQLPAASILPVASVATSVTPMMSAIPPDLEPDRVASLLAFVHTRLHSPLYHREFFPDADMEVIGTGTIGEKSGDLRKKSAVLKEVGLEVPHRVVFAHDFLEMIIAKSGYASFDDPTIASSPSLFREAIREMTPHLLNALSSLPPGPVAVRSSAEFDSRGTGTYESRYCDFDPQHPEDFLDAFQCVLESYFRSKARAYREKLQAPSGYAIMVEPLVGQCLDNWLYAPVISGIAYTSSPQGSGYISIVPGLGGGVDKRAAHKISSRDVARGTSLLDVVTTAFIDQLQRRTAGEQTPYSLLASPFDPDGNPNNPFMNTFGTAFDLQAGESLPIAHLTSRAQSLYSSIDLSRVFTMLTELEKKLGVPQYVEFAITVDGQKPRVHITQTSDAALRPDVSVELPGKPLYAAHSVVGTGIKKSNAIILVPPGTPLHHVAKLNSQYRDYILLYPVSMSHGDSSDRGLTFAVLNHAGAILEYADTRGQHLREPASHWQGLLDSTGIPFGVLDHAYGEHPASYTQCQVILGNFTVAASAAQEKLVVYEDLPGTPPTSEAPSGYRR